MTNAQEKWSLQVCSQAIAAELERTGQRAIAAAREIAKSTEARNQAARELDASLQVAVVRLQSETNQRAPLPALLSACSRAWREEEQTHSSALSTARAQLDAQSRAVSHAVNSIQRCVANSDAWDFRAQAMLTQASSTEEQLFRVTEECSQLTMAMGAIQAELLAICQGVGR
jgi:hypothetical protein